MPVYGEVRPLDDDELNVLRLPPKMATFEPVKVNAIKVALEVANTKSRTDRRQRDFHENGVEVTESKAPKSKEEVINEHKHREVYDHEEKVISFANMIPSDVKSNPKLILPKPRSVREEVELKTRDKMVMNES